VCEIIFQVAAVTPTILPSPFLVQYAKCNEYYSYCSCHFLFCFEIENNGSTQKLGMNLLFRYTVYKYKVSDKNLH